VDLLTVDEVSAYLKVPVGTLYNWRSRGEGPRAARLGRHLRYRRSDLEAWIAERARADTRRSA
jgi:excisionase family DNA binding protein